jgi:hypothetical protein
MGEQPKRHVPLKVKCLRGTICAHCGLLYLKNEATQKRLAKPCEGIREVIVNIPRNLRPKELYE